MPWGWNARGALPSDASVGVTGGGNVGTAEEAKVAHAWPRYEAEYLKRALTSDKHKYDTTGLDSEQRQVYLDKVTNGYKTEADEALKGEFDLWLQGMHAANNADADNVYVNTDGKPIRRWTMRTKEAEDSEGGTKVGLPRAGWKHTPWGAAPLTHLTGVREYLSSQMKQGHDNDTPLQLLAELGPQNLEQAWMYFKHWVKGRPVTDAVTQAPGYDHQPRQRSEFGNQMPARFYEYRADQPDAQPGVLARDENANTAAAVKPYEEVPDTPAFSAQEDPRHEARLVAMRQFREQLESTFQDAHVGENQQIDREEAAEARDNVNEAMEDAGAEALRADQKVRDVKLHDTPMNILPDVKL